MAFRGRIIIARDRDGGRSNTRGPTLGLPAPMLSAVCISAYWGLAIPRVMVLGAVGAGWVVASPDVVELSDRPDMLSS